MMKTFILYLKLICFAVLFNNSGMSQVAHELEQKNTTQNNLNQEPNHKEREMRRELLLSNPDLKKIGNPKVYRGEYLDAIDFTVGGLGAGCVRFDGEGKIAVWQMNSNHAQIDIPNSFFAVRTQSGDEKSIVKVLQSSAEGPFDAVGGLEFRGEYPFGWYSFIDESIPVKIAMEVYNPFIPLDSKNSGIPCAIINFTLSNPGTEAVDVSLLAAQQNPTGFTGHIVKSYGSFNGAFDEQGIHKLRNVIKDRSHPEYGKNKNVVIKKKDSVVLHLMSGKASDNEGFGDVALTASGENWELNGGASWKDLEELKHQFSSHGKIAGPTAAGPSAEGKTIDGFLCGSTLLQPGESKTLSFCLSWYYPNAILGGEYSPNWKAAAWGGGGWGGIGSQYLNWWSSALDVSDYVYDNIKMLDTQTRLYHKTFYESNLPYWLRNRISSQTAVLKSLTCFWTRDGYFGGWEGCGSTNGSCAGNCAHVWHYAQAHAHLFPDVARLMRQQEFAVQKDDGMIPYRQPKGHASFDGQCGVILGSYREHLLCSNSDWLMSNYDSIKNAADYIISRWDKDEDGQLSGGQHNTLDSALSGNSSWMGSLYAASMSAMSKMSKIQNDSDSERYRRISNKAIKFHQSKLWNGEYFFQIPDENNPLADYGQGCAMDQLLGQWWAHQIGLSWLYDKEKSKTAMASVFKYNFRSSFVGINQKPREFVKDNEAGMQMIVWPKGNRPKRHTSYADEVMSGFEYSTAALMIKSGLLREGLTVLKSVDDRYDGKKRTGYKGEWGNWGFSGNPYGDDECGKFYSRALSIWSVLLLLQGFQFDGPQGIVGFDPIWQPENHVSFFTAGTGWGLFHQDRLKKQQLNQLKIKHGTLILNEIHLVLPKDSELREISILENGIVLKSDYSLVEDQLSIKFLDKIELSENDELLIKITF